MKYSIDQQISFVIAKDNTNISTQTHLMCFRVGFSFKADISIEYEFCYEFSQQMLHYFSILKFLCCDSSNVGFSKLSTDTKTYKLHSSSLVLLLPKKLVI